MRSRCTRHRHQRSEFFLQQIKCCVYSALKIYSEARLLQFIPRSGLHCFVSSSIKNLDFGHQAGASRARIRRRSSSLSIRVAVPASICPSLRNISRSQASSASGSLGSSRLTIKSWANCARSDSDSSRTSDRNVSKLVLPIQVIPFKYSWPRQRFQNSAPNYQLQRTRCSDQHVFRHHAWRTFEQKRYALSNQRRQWVRTASPALWHSYGQSIYAEAVCPFPFMSLRLKYWACRPRSGPSYLNA